MRTNRICPLYEQYEAEMAAMASSGQIRGNGGSASESSIGTEPGAVRVQGTKISITKATLVTTVAQQRALSQWSLFLQDILAALVALPSSWPFRRPVSRKEYPHYFRMISRPVDLGTIRSRARRLFYRSLESFRSDVRLIMTNCIQFNLEDHPFSTMAKEVVAEAERMLEQKKDQIDAWMAELHPHRSKDALLRHDAEEQEDVVMEDFLQDIEHVVEHEVEDLFEEAHDSMEVHEDAQPDDDIEMT
jgi:hypothetical protein